MQLKHRAAIGAGALIALGLGAVQPTMADSPAQIFTSNSLTEFRKDSNPASLGYTFTPTSNITVTALGYVNDGYGYTHTVQIWQVTKDPTNYAGDGTGFAVPGATAAVTTTATTGNVPQTTFNYVSITPVQLQAGVHYEVMANDADDLVTSGTVSGIGYWVNADNTFDSRITYGEPAYTYGFGNLFGTSTVSANFVGDIGPNFLIAPEPSTLAAFAFTGLGALGLMLRARKRRSVA